MHSVAIKPIIYAGLVLKFFNKIKFVAAMGGVGYIFASNSIEARVLRPLVVVCLRLALRKREQYSFCRTTTISGQLQTMELLIKWTSDLSVVQVSRLKILFNSHPRRSASGCFASQIACGQGCFGICICRKAIKNNSIKARFALVGDIDPTTQPLLVRHKLTVGLVRGL